MVIRIRNDQMIAFIMLSLRHGSALKNINLITVSTKSFENTEQVLNFGLFVSAVKHYIITLWLLWCLKQGFQHQRIKQNREIKFNNFG